MTSLNTTDPVAATRRAGLTLSTEWLNDTVVRISAQGDIDASNSAEVLEYVFRHGANSRSMILDFRDVTFFATAGFSALQNIDTRCSDAEVSWMVVPSQAVSRVLSVCDPSRSLPRGVA